MAFIKFGKKGGQDEENLDGELLTEEELAGAGTDEGDDSGEEEAPKKKGRKAGKPKKNGRKKKSEIARNFRESVWAQARKEFEANEVFKSEFEGQACYYGLAVNDDNLKSAGRGSEDKGAFTNAIESGNIKSYASQETLEAGYIVIIPTPDSMENLSEFGFLYNGSLDIVRVYSDGKAELNDYEITCEDVYNLAMGNIQAVSLGDDVLTREEPEKKAPAMNKKKPAPAPEPVPVPEPVAVLEPEPEPEPMQELEDTGAGMPVPDMGLDEFGMEPDAGYGEPAYEEPEPEPAYQEPAYQEPVYGDPGQGYESPEGDVVQEEFDPGYLSPDGSLFGEPEEGAWEGDGEPEGPSPDEYISRQLETITQVFCPEDLKLEVSTAPFDAQFGNMDMVLFTETRPDGFFSEYLNSYCSVANVSLLQMREKNVAKLREMYLGLMGRVCDQISKDLNIDDPSKDTKFVRMRNSIADRKRAAEERMAEEVSLEASRIEQEWQESLKLHMEQAAERAKVQFSQNYGRQHQQRKLDVEAEVKTRVEVEYVSGMNELQELRRKTAGMMLEAGTNVVLSQISAYYQQMQEQEDALYERHAREIQDYIAEAREDEMARTNVLANEQRQKAEAVRVREEMESRMAADAEMFRRKAADYESQIRKLEEDMARKIKETDESYKERLQNARVVEKDLRESIRQKDEAIAGVEERVKAEYKHRLEVKEDLLKSSEDRMQGRIADLEERNRYDRKMNIVVLVGAVVAALFFGMILGSTWFAKLGTDKSAELPGDVSGYEQMMDMEEEETALS